jgi:hypothetical protein
MYLGVENMTWTLDWIGLTSRFTKGLTQYSRPDIIYVDRLLTN